MFASIIIYYYTLIKLVKTYFYYQNMSFNILCKLLKV